MKPAKSSTRKVRSRSGKSLLSNTPQGRRRGSTFKLESLEERLLLSTSSSTESNLLGSAAASVVAASNLSTGLADSVTDASTVATVAAPSTSTPTSVSSSILSSHIYTGPGSTFIGPVSGSSSSTPTTSTNPGQYNPNAPSLAALQALAKTLKAVPQYFVVPSSELKGEPQNFSGPAGYAPAQVAGAYGINDVSFDNGVVGNGAGQTIALVDAGDYTGFVNSTDPNFGSSALAVFDSEFGLPNPPSFTKYNEYGQTSPLPSPQPGWGLEITLDVEWAHAMAPDANIDLVESSGSSFDNLSQASYSAATVLGASVVSQSWGLLETELGGSFMEYLENTYYAPALAANPNVTFVAATGDGSAENGPIFPSISPLNVGAGGTSLYVNGDTYSNETAWSGGGGGPSMTFPLPSYQQGVIAANYPTPGVNSPLTVRTAPDVAAVANPSTGVSVYDPVDYGGWVQVGGTSVATPITSATYAIADQGRVSLGGQPLNGPNQLLPGLYAAYESGNAYTPGTGYFHDITQGDNGYEAGPGYDLTTGIGSEQAENLLPFLALYDLGPAVVASDPAQGQVITTTPPTTFSLTFNEPIVPSSVEAADFSVNGVPADSDILSPDGETITYTFTSSPVINQGLETMSLPADSVIGANDGQYNHAAFDATFFYVNTQLQVTTTSPAPGSVYDIPSAPGTIDLVVQFNEAVNPYAVNTSDFQVSAGTVSSAVPLTPQSVDLTITGLTQDGLLTLTLPYGALTDQYGVPNLGYTANYVIDFASLAYPTPLAQQVPAGSLIYDPTVTGAVGFGSPSNVDTFTLGLVAGQTLSLALTPGSSLTGTVTLEDPDGVTIGTATGTGPGSPVVLESAPIATSGTYTLIVGASGGTSGTFSLQAILNALFKPSTLSINTIGTAYDLTSAFQSLGTTPSAEEAGIVGTLGTTPTDFYAISLTAGELTTIAAKGTNGTASVALYDSSGNLLTDGAAGAAGSGVDSVISDFVAQVSGTYYLEVSGAIGLSYDAVVTRGADFDIHGNSYANAQPLNGASVVLGAIVKPASPLEALDLEGDNFSNIYQTNALTGAFGNSFLSPVDDGFYLFGQNMASDGIYTYYNDGYGGSNEIYQLNSSGVVVSSGNPVPGGAFTGLAYLNGSLYGADVSGDVYQINPSTWTVTASFYQPALYPLTGLAGDAANGDLYAVSQFHDLYEVDPTTGDVLASAGDGLSGTNYEQDLAFADGLLIVSVSDGSDGPGNNFLTEYDPNTLAFVQQVDPPYTYAASGLAGDGLGGGNADYYQFNVNAGDSLVITTTTPGASSASGLQFANDLDPTINLYDGSGNLVDSFTGTGTFTYTATTAGSYVVEIDGSSNTNLGEYTLSITGDTGGLNPFQITSTNPAAGSDIGYQVSTLSATFSSSVLLSSISDSDFTIDGTEATSATLSSSNTVVFTFPTTSDGVHNVTISGVEDLQGVVAPTDSFSFTTDDVPPTVVSSSIADGATLTAGPLTEVITFSKPIQPSSANDSDILLYGEVRDIEYTPSSISFDPTDTIMTITYAYVPTDAYTFTLEAGPSNFLSDAGVPLQSSFTINFTVALPTNNIVSLQPVLPLGSLVYETTIDNVLLSPTDSDTYDVTINPEQTLSVIATPVTSSLKVTVTLISPTGVVIGTATSPSAGAPALLPVVQSAKGGTYEIVITGNEAGEYTVEPVLNAYVDPSSYGGNPNGSIATATPIDPYANNFAGDDNRTAVLGSIQSGGYGDGDALVVEYDDVILIDQATGNVLQRYTSPDFDDLILFDVALAKDNTFYVLGDFDDFTGVIVHMNLAGQTLGEFTMPVSDSSGYLSPEGFGYDPTDGSFWVPLTNSATLVHVNSTGSLIAEYSIPANPDDAGVGPNGDVYISQVFADTITQLDPSTGSYSTFASADFPFGVTWSVAGDLWVGALDEGLEEFNSSGDLINVYNFEGVTAGEPALSGNVWSANIFYDEVFQQSSSGNYLTETFFEPEQPGLAVLGDVPGEAPFGSPNSPYYSFQLNAGESASIVAQSLNNENVGFTLLDDNGNVIGYSSQDASNYTSGMNNFVAPYDGTFYVEMTGDPGVQFNLVVTRGADFNTQPANQYPSAQDITATELTGDNKLGGVLGYLQASNGTDYYSVNVNAGDNLAFTTTTPSGGQGLFANTLDTELLLFDANGNLVAIAAGNAPDGRNSVIDFTVPDGDAGTWTIAVTTPNGTWGEYDLLATGATGALSPFYVTATTPASGVLVQPPTDIYVTFNDSVDAESLTSGELEVNGVSATAVTLVNANTVDWSVPASAFATGVDLPNVVTIGADAYGDQATNLSGQNLTPYSYTFFTTNVPPQIVSSSIDGQVFSPAPADVTEVVTFNQPMDTSFTTQSSFSLYGTYNNTYYAAASYSWDPTDTILTITYDNLPNDLYTLTLYASGFESQVGITLSSNYVANFAVAAGTTPFSGKFTGVNPAGSLIYTGSDTQVLVDPTDVDYLTVSLDAGETLTLVGTPDTSSLQLWLTVLDPNGNVVAYTAAPAQGTDAVIETATAATTGTYTIVVYDVNGNIGQYTINATLNAYVKTGTSNATIATADDLSGSSYGLDSTGDDRLAAVGSLPSAVVGIGDVYVSSRYYGYYYGGSPSDILRVNSAGDIVQVIQVPQDTEGSLAGVELDPVNNMLYAAITTSFNGYGGPGSGSVDGELLEFNPITGALVNTITLPVDNANFYWYYPYGFSIDPSGNFWIPQPNSGNIIELNPSYTEVASYFTDGLLPESASYGADGNVYFSTTVGDVYQLVPSTGAVNYFAYTESPFGTLTDTAPNGAGIWAGDWYQGGLLYNYSGSLTELAGYYGANQAQTAALSGPDASNTWIVNGSYWDLQEFDQYGDQLVDTYVPAPVGETIWGVDNANPPAQDTQDYYSFSLAAGQTATTVVESLNGDAAQIAIVDADGNVLATGVSGATNVSQSIENFVAPATGTYYVEITGTPGLQYSVVVTRGVDFTIQPHNSSDTAQNITGTNGVLGYLAPPSSPLYVLDDQLGELGNAYNPIYPTNVATGAFTGPAIYAPGSPLNNPFGLNMAYDGTYLYYNNGGYDGDNEIYKLDTTTGAVVAQGNPDIGSGEEAFTGLAYLNGYLYGSNIDGDIYQMDPNTFAVISEVSQPALYPLTGLAGDPTNGELYAVSQFNDLFALDPSTGAILNEAVIPALAYEQDLAYAGGLLIVAEAEYFGSGGGYLQEFDPTTFALVNTVPVATEGYVAGLGGDGLGGTPPVDYYSINVQAGQSLSIVSSTPSDQGGEFPNTASLEISVYDTFGNLIAQGVKLPDGRNESLSFNAPYSGAYTIEVSEDPGGAGEYFLSVDTASYASGGISGQVYNDVTGSGTYEPGDTGLQGWEVDLVNDSTGYFVGTYYTDANGDFSFQGLDPGTYTVNEDVPYGWTQTAPASVTFTVFVAAGQDVTGLQFGNFQDITVSGQVYNDLDGTGVQEPADPGLAGWTVNLYNSSGALVATQTTDANGDYSFNPYDASGDLLGPGTYTIQEVVPAGWVQTAPAPPGTYTVTATSGLVDTGLDFGNFEEVTYSGTVYNDLYGTGVIAPGDPALQGWTVALFSTGGSLVATTTSAADGSYSFADVAPGSYYILEFTQAGWYQTEPGSPFVYSVTAISGASESGLNFGNFELIDVTGTVYNDLNDSGSIEPGDPGLQGWTVILENQYGNVVATTTSDANGNYSFDDVYPGTFIVEEVLQSGWIQTQPVNPGYYTFAAESGTNEALNFGNYSPSILSGTVYNDLDGSGTIEPTDPGLVGWTINLETTTGTIVDTTTSGSGGSYQFTGVAAGTYLLEEVVQSGWVETEPVNPDYYEITPGGQTTGLNFGNYLGATASGTIYNDLTGSGSYVSGDPLLSGWTVDLLNSSGTIVATTTSNSSGAYTFSPVGPGTYTISEVVPSGWLITQPANPPGTWSVTSTEGGTTTGLNFGNFQLVTVNGSVYDDLLGTGAFNKNDPYLSGWTVDLLDSSGNVIASALTSSSGGFSFTGVGPGTYGIAQVVQPNWVQTQPFYPVNYSLTTRSGTTPGTLSFGDYADPAITPTSVIGIGQPGYSQTGTWSSSVGGYLGTNRVTSTSTRIETATASFTFSNVTTGYYLVYVTYVGASSYSSAAPYSVMNDGVILSGVPTVNQSIKVTQTQGLTQGSYGGVGWVELGDYEVQYSANVVVQLNNKTNFGNHVDADGAMLVYVDPLVIRSPAPAASNPTKSIGVVPFTANTVSPSDQTSTTSHSVAPTVSISGVSAPSAVQVVYNQGPQTSSTPSSTSLVDAVLGTIDGSVTSLISGKKKTS